MAWWYFKKRRIEDRGFFAMFNIADSFDKASPVIWFFFFAILLIIVGMVIYSLIALIYVGIVIVCIYVIYWILWALRKSA